MALTVIIIKFFFKSIKLNKSFVEPFILSMYYLLKIFDQINIPTYHESFSTIFILAIFAQKSLSKSPFTGIITLGIIIFIDTFYVNNIFGH